MNDGMDSDEAMEGLKSSNLLVGFLDAEKKTETLDGKDFLTFEVAFFCGLRIRKWPGMYQNTNKDS